MSYRLAESLKVLRDEVNAAYPGRPKQSDGWIGDAKHSSRASDHNPNSLGVVCAFDFTEWVKDNTQMNVLLAEYLRALKDPRLKYVICKGRMFSSYASKKDGRVVRKAWEWGPYIGPNGHFQHVHVSVHGSYDNDDPWGFGAKTSTEDKDNDMTHEQEKRLHDLINNMNRRIGICIRNQRDIAAKLGMEVDPEHDDKIE